MIQPTAGFICHGGHKDGLKDPMGQPFIDEEIVARSKRALAERGVNLVEHGVAVATKDEARTVLKRMKNDDNVDCVVLFSGTWVWAAHLIGDGACPPSLAGRLGPAGFAEHGIPTEGEAGGLSVSLVCKVGEGVLARLGRVDGKFTMVITRCSIFEPPADQIQARRRECGIPFWPHGFVTVHCDVDELLEHWTSEYACLGYGAHLHADLADFCRLTGVQAVLP